MAQASTPNPAPRYPELDGIRGFAAFAVLLFHFGPEAFGTALPMLRSPWLMPWINGHRAVQIFFVLSGDALASACMRPDRGRALAQLAVRRYVRLTVPIGLSALIVYGLMRAGLACHRDAAILVQSGWLWGFLNFEPSATGLAFYVLRDVYTGFAAPQPYNGFLWTMAVELLGSYFVFLLCFALPYLQSPRTFLWLVAGLLLGLDSFYGLFVLGVLLAQLRADGVLDRLRRIRAVDGLALLVPFAVYVREASTPTLPYAHTLGMFVGSAALVLCMYVASPYRWLFATRFAQWLGGLSFPLYLVQAPVLLSGVSFLVNRYYRVDAPHAQRTLLLVIGAGALMAVVAARLFQSLERALVPPLERAVARWVRAPD
jgi:peptidoglycan/LPS O-acetylase OafA/YrhL